jgi:hypothetical protein
MEAHQWGGGGGGGAESCLLDRQTETDGVGWDYQNVKVHFTDFNH